ncbi:hypothetical protein [Anaerolentibacter hominis]|uniref:hypothetical protein n=1 Tax=Anaerolentibacter hominis TaxID=3079009 RepID=UPI0031B804B0
MFIFLSAVLLYAAFFLIFRENKEVTSAPEGLTLTLIHDQVTADTVVVSAVLNNQTAEAITAGPELLQKSENGSWCDIKPVEYPLFYEVGKILRPNESMPVQFFSGACDLAPGQYRIGIGAGGNTYALCDFTVLPSYTGFQDISFPLTEDGITGEDFLIIKDDFIQSGKDTLETFLNMTSEGKDAALRYAQIYYPDYPSLKTTVSLHDLIFEDGVYTLYEYQEEDRSSSCLFRAYYLHQVDLVYLLSDKTEFTWEDYNNAIYQPAPDDLKSMQYLFTIIS